MSMRVVGKRLQYTALHVEEDPQVGRFIRRILSDEKAKVLTARNGSRALQIAGRNHLDLVVLGLKLPDVPGTEILRRLRSINPEVPIIMVASCGSIGTVRAAMELGAFEYLTRPLDSAEMTRVVREALLSPAMMPMLLRA